MLSTVFNPCSYFSSFLLDWNERGWIVIHRGNLTSDYQIFFLLTFEEITDVFLVFNSMCRYKDGSIDWLNTIAMFTMEGGLMFTTFAQFLFKLLFSRGTGGMKETFGNSRGEGGGLFSFTKMEIPERWGVLAGIPSVVGVWIFSGTTHCLHVQKPYLYNTLEKVSLLVRLTMLYDMFTYFLLSQVVVEVMEDL